MRVKTKLESSKTDKAEFSSDYINVILQTPYELLSDAEKRVIRRIERENLTYERFLRRMGIAYKGQLTPTEVKRVRRANRRFLEHKRVVDELRRSRLEPTPQQLHKVPTQNETKPMVFFRLWPTGELCNYDRFMREYWPAIKKRYEKLEKQRKQKRQRRRSRVRENAYADFKKRILGSG